MSKSNKSANQAIFEDVRVAAFKLEAP